jgi:hypothetical protein
MNTFRHSLGRPRTRAAAVALTGFWISGGIFAEAQTNSAPTEASTATAAGTNTTFFSTTNTATGTTNTAAVTTNTIPGSDVAKSVSEFKPLAPGEYNNWLNVGVGNYFVSGDKGQFQQRSQQRAGTFGGVEDFHYETSFEKKGLFTIDGRGIFDEHDYDVTLGLSYPDLGYVRGGFKQSRTYYDGSGGFFPPNGQWFNLYNDALSLDRGEAWIEAGLTIPNFPFITFRYSHEFRDGLKDSTIWGDTALTGGLGTRAIVPSFYDINEHRNILQLDAKHTIGNTEVGLGGTLDFLSQDDSLNIRRRPGETGTTVAGPGTSIDRVVTQQNGVDADSYNVHGFTSTRFNDKTLLTIGGSFTKLDTDISGSRIYGPDYDPVYDPNFVRRQERDSGFLDLTGGAVWRQYVGNVSFMFTPCEHLDLVPSLRVEHANQSGVANFISTDVGPAPTFTSTQEPLENQQERNFTDVSEALELRYTGITNWVYYVRGEWLEGQGDLTEVQANLEVAPPAPTIERDTDSTRLTQKYVLGINWYASRKLNFALQYFHKERNNDYNHEVDSTSNATNSGNRYPAFLVAQNFKTDDTNFRVTWRPWTLLSSVSRYDFQLSTIDTTGDNLNEIQSGNMVSHIFSEALTLTPWNPVYLQLSGMYVWDQVDTPATVQPGAAAGLVSKSRNGYWNLNANVGVALDDRTDLQASYSYYESNDFMNNSAVSTPYGDESREHGVTVTLTRMLSPRVRLTLKYGFFDYNDVASGGHNNYRAHLVYSGLQFRF